jgi:predicted RNA methylase
MNGGVVLLELDYTIRIKHSYKWHQYVLQNVLILKAVQVTFYMMEPLHTRSSPNSEQTHDHCMCR